MNKLNSWIEKIGADKLLHFFASAWFVAECKPYGSTTMLLGFVAIILLSIVKEYLLDEKGEYKDIISSVLGGVFSILLFVFENIIYTITR
jgi:hypothetical protein